MKKNEIQMLLDRFEGDEKVIFVELLRRLDRGRAQYGPWNITDSRNYAQEALEEVLDALLYIAAELVRRKQS